MIATGSTGLPAEGLGAVPAQIAARLPDGHACAWARRSARSSPGGVMLDDGERIAARAVVVATDGSRGPPLLGERVADPGSRAGRLLLVLLPAPPCAAASDPRRRSRGPALNVVVMSEVQPSYAPAGRALIAAAVPGPAPWIRASPTRSAAAAALVRLAAGAGTCALT